MSDEIKVVDNTNDITIINNEDVFEVEDNNSVTTIVNNQDVFEVTEDIGDKIVINATDVLISSPQQDIDMNCTATEQIGDVVYVSGDGEVRQANNADISTAKVMGFIISKPTTTTCKVKTGGIIDVFTGLSVGSQYFLDSVSGDITDVPATTGVLVRTGQAIKNDVLLININNNYIIRNG